MKSCCVNRRNCRSNLPLCQLSCAGRMKTLESEEQLNAKRLWPKMIFRKWTWRRRLGSEPESLSSTELLSPPPHPRFTFLATDLENSWNDHCNIRDWKYSATHNTWTPFNFRSFTGMTTTNDFMMITISANKNSENWNCCKSKNKSNFKTWLTKTNCAKNSRKRDLSRKKPFWSRTTRTISNLWSSNRRSRWNALNSLIKWLLRNVDFYCGFRWTKQRNNSMLTSRWPRRRSEQNKKRSSKPSARVSNKKWSFWNTRWSSYRR